jgi:hypothetical protein
MARAKKHYSRYFIVRGDQTLWKGDPAGEGSQFRQFVITSNEFTSTLGTCQVYGLEGTGNGIQNGKLAISDDEPSILFDQEFNGLEAAGRQFKDLVKQSEADGFVRMTFWDILEFEAKLQASH